jgi:hypothetical protein
MIFLSILYNLFIVIFIVSIIALALTKILNPTASIKEIFQYWKKVYKNGI